MQIYITKILDIKSLYLSVCFFIRSIILLAILLKPLHVKASSFKDILTTLSAISCETIFMVTELYYPQTCVPQITSEMLSSMLAPAMYPWAKSRLVMNNTGLFRDNCSREKRVDYYNPKIDFGFCSNTKLLPLRSEALIYLLGNLLINIFSGNNPWSDIKKDWYIEPSKYIQKYNDVEPGTIGYVVDINMGAIANTLTVDIDPTRQIQDLSYISAFPWKVIKKNDQVCVSTMSLIGWIPVGCKYMIDPYLYSKYHYFFHSSPITDPNAAKSGITFEDFTNTCYVDAMSNSKTLVPISGPIITCINQSLTQMLVSKAVTRVDQISDISNSAIARSTSSLYTFQQNMRFIVTILLTLYVIFIGFDILLGGGHIEKGNLIRYVVKLILVTYFAIGINLTPADTTSTPRDGMTDWILPIVFGGANELAQIIMSLTSGINGLCYFDASQYPKGYSYLALWDTLDCRISSYLGLDALADFMSVSNSGNPNFNSLSFSIPPWVFLLIPAAISGNMTLIGLVLAFPFLVLSVASYMVYSFVVCIISITILSVLAPIFIPMVLFEYTRSYFDSWMKLVLSFVLQPMIVCVFMTTMFSVFDLGFFGTCKYRSVNVSQMFEGALQNKKLFVIDNNPAMYNESEKANCVYSLGYMFNAPFSFVGNTLSGIGDSITNIDQASQNSDSIDSPTVSTMAVTDSSGNVTSVGTTSSAGQTFEKTKSKHSFLSRIKTKTGLFFSYPILHGGIKQFSLTLFAALFALYLMYNLSTQVAAFASDMTEGVIIEGAHMSPEFGNDREDEGEGQGDASDTASSGEEDSSDTASSGEENAGDTASTGGAESSDVASSGSNASDNASAMDRSKDTALIESGDNNSTPLKIDNNKPTNNSDDSDAFSINPGNTDRTDEGSTIPRDSRSADDSDVFTKPRESDESSGNGSDAAKPIDDVDKGDVFTKPKEEK